jgi:pimeloyl-ACP methyl ester carboxylesterase
MDARFAASSGSRVYVEDAGGGIPVLALHGLGGGAYFFSGLSARLSRHCRVVSVDLPGTGRSTPTLEAMSPDRWIADLGELVRETIGAPVILLGHSLGTMLALNAWEAWPAWIRAMVLVGGLPKVRPEIHDRLSQRAQVVKAQGLVGLGPQVAAGNLSPETMDRQPELAALFARVFETQRPDVYLRGIEILLGLSMESVPATVGVPVLALTGRDDVYAPPDLVRSFMCQVPAGRTEVLPACGHLPFLEAPEAFATIVRAFVAELGPA